MTYTVSITSQGQISIPAPLRRKLGFDRLNKALIVEKEGKIIVEPIMELLDLKGSLKADKSVVPSLPVREAFEEFIARRRLIHK